MWVDADIAALLYTIIIDAFVLLILHVVHVFVSDATPSAASRFITSASRTIRARASSILGVTATSTIQSPTSDQLQAQELVRGVVITPRIARLSIVAANAKQAATRGLERQTSSTPRNLAVVTESLEEENEEQKSYDPDSLDVPSEALTLQLPTTPGSRKFSAPPSPSLGSHHRKDTLDSIEVELSLEALATLHSAAIFDEPTDEDAFSILPAEDLDREIEDVITKNSPRAADEPAGSPSSSRGDSPSASSSSTSSIPGTPLASGSAPLPPSISDQLRQAFDTQHATVQVIQPTLDVVMDNLDAPREFDHAGNHVAKVYPVTVLPIQSDVKLSDQSLISPPTSTILPFRFLDPLLGKIFPPMQLLSANTADGIVYLKFSQLLLVLVGFMTLLCCTVLLPVHETQNPVEDATSFTAASIASVESGSPWFLAHFIVAYLMLTAFVTFLILLRKLGAQALVLSAAVKDDPEGIAAARTIHVTHLPTNFTDELLRKEIIQLLPPELAKEPDKHILSISLFHDVSTLAKLYEKLTNLRNQAERLEILALQIQARPRARVKAKWLKLLGKDKPVKQQLQELTRKRKDKVLRIVDGVLEYYERLAVAKEAQEHSAAEHHHKRLLLHSASAGALRGNGVNGMDHPSLPHSASAGCLPHTVGSHHGSSPFPSLSSHSFRCARGVGLASSSSKKPQTLAPKFSGNAFVAFRRATTAVEVLKRTTGDISLTGSMDFAPRPSDFLWPNLAAQETVVVGATRWLIANSSLIALALFVGIPLLVLHQLTDLTAAETDGLDTVNDTNNRVLLLICNYSITLIIWLINRRYSPFMIRKALDFEMHATVSEYQTSRFWKSSLFLFAYLILLPVATMTTTTDLISKHRQTRWYQILSNAFFVNSGVYWAQFLTHDILVNTGMNLLMPMFVLKRIWKLSNALTEREFEKAKEEPIIELDYDKHVAKFGLLLLNSVTVPLLLPFGLVYFAVTYFIDSWRLRRFKVAPSFNLGMGPITAIRCMLLYLAGWQGLMSALFFVQNRKRYSGMGIFFLLSAIASGAVYAWRKVDTKVPMEARQAACKHVDEKVKLFEEPSVEVPDEEQKSAPDPSHAATRFVHIHAHRSPTFAGESSGSSLLHHDTSIDPSICPDCLYRHPVWYSIETDHEILPALQERMELIRLQSHARENDPQASMQDAFILVEDDHKAQIVVKSEKTEAKVSAEPYLFK